MNAEEPPAQTETERAVDLAYRAVSRRERTVAELRMFLERKRVGPAGIDAAVAALRDAGQLDDERYARRFADDKRELERWGTERIARDLRRRGVPPELVERTVADSRPADELGTALSLLADRVPTPLRHDRDRDRAWRLLVRRGYPPELAYEAVRTHERGLDSRRAA
jgi:regulatory protein